MQLYLLPNNVFKKNVNANNDAIGCPLFLGFKDLDLSTI
jgi:hypothetical protein